MKLEFKIIDSKVKYKILSSIKLKILMKIVIVKIY